ncbi:MAG: universal stress protein [Bryobacterales bacterium]|nr:universal stress protein [Bryobacterales bacterium]
MNLFENILFPVDFSHRSEALTPFVAATANRFQARLTLLHVLDLPRAGEEPPFADLTEEFSQKLRSFGADAFAGRFVQHALRTGRPAKEIVRFVEDENVDLVVMPTHGFTRFRQLLLGSVTASVLHDASCAVWTSAHCEEAGAVHADVQTVVCAIDMSRASIGVLAKAREVAEAYGAALHVVHSVPAVDPRFYSEVAAHAHRFLVDSAHREYHTLAGAADVDVPLVVLEGPGLASSIAAKCKAEGADLLIIGRGHVKGVLGRLRTNSHDLIRLSPCPVLSL